MPRPIVQMIDSFDGGGSERQAVQLARLLQATGRYRVVVAALRNHGPLYAELRSAGIEVFLFPVTSFHDVNTAVQLARLVQLIRTSGAEILQTNDYSTNMFGMVAAALARVPVRIASLRSGLRTPSRRRLERFAFRLADCVIVNSDSLGMELRCRGLPEGKVALIPNGLDPARVSPRWTSSTGKQRVATGLPPYVPSTLVTIVANMNRQVKDHQTFLRAAQRVHNECPSAGFVLAGDGALRPGLEDLACDLGLSGSAFFVGDCQAIGDLLALSTVCVLSSRAEGLPNAILEYMAAGRPVVSTMVGGAREVLKDAETGYLVAPGDDAAMAERILRLLRDPVHARTMGARGQLIVRHSYSTSAQLERIEALYGRLLTCTRRFSNC